MRFRFIGSVNEDAESGPFIDGASRYALLPTVGEVSHNLVPGFRFPRTFDPDSLVRMLPYGVREYEMVITGHAPPGDDDESEDFSLTYTFLPPIAQEFDIVSDAGRFPQYEIAGYAGSVTYTPTDEEEEPTTVDPYDPNGAAGVPSGTITFNRYQADLPFAAEVEPELRVDYYYNPELELYLPRIELNISPFLPTDSTLFLIGNYEMTSSNPSVLIQTFGGTMFGQSVTMSVAVNADKPLDSFTFNLYANVYWEYRDQEGNNPLYHFDSGEALMDHRTLVD
jgi:hypothetical protein